ncbi:MAG TPA: hypothetical protein VJQ25_05910 [Nitrospira sp.]|nr:hypothetical protein [Nitrospira sp.]
MAIPSSIIGIFTSFIPGFRLIDGGQLKSMAEQLFSYQTGIASIVDGTYLTSTPLTAQYSVVTTSTSSNTDGVTLPFAIPGREVWVENRTANTITVFGAGANPITGTTDGIIPNASTSATAGNTGVTQATAIMAVYKCAVAGTWKKGSVA